METSEAALPAFEADRQTGLYLLAVLTGRAPADYPAQVAECADLPSLSQPIPVGEALSRAQTSAALSASQANKLFRFGRADFLSLLDAQRSLASAQAQSADANIQVMEDQIAVFLALGGGWQP